MYLYTPHSQLTVKIRVDTVAGAEASAMIYSIAETAKANNLKPYTYFKYLLEEIPRHMDEHGVDFSEYLLSWYFNIWKIRR